MAGVGVPQVTAIMEALAACRPAGVPVIGDGGMQYSGDIAKAIVAGADTVMLGSLLAGCEESPGELIFINGKQFKSYRGHGLAGRDAVARPGPVVLARTATSRTTCSPTTSWCPRASRARCPTAARWPRWRTSSSAACARRWATSAPATIAELQERGQLMRITAAGLKESHPHDIQMTVEAPELPLAAEPMRSVAVRDVVEIGMGKTAQRGYHLDDIAIVPSRRTRDVDDVSTAWQLDAYQFKIPCVAHPRDAIMSPATAVALGRLGGLGVLNVEGLWTPVRGPDQAARVAGRARRATAPPRPGGCRRSTPSRSSRS